MNIYILTILLPLLLLIGCSTTQEIKVSEQPINNALYDGKPSLTLSNDFPPVNAEEAAARGDKALVERNYDLALYEYIRALTFNDNPMITSLYNKIGLIHQQRGNLELAKLAFTRTIAHQPNDITAYTALGIVELKMGERETARFHLTKAIALDQHRLNNDAAVTVRSALSLELLILDPNSPTQAYNGLAIIYDMDGNNSSAQQLYKAILEVKPKWLNAQINLGYSYYLSGNIEQAEFYTHKAANMALSNPKIWSNLSLIYAKQQKYNDAVDLLSRVQERAEACNDIGYFAMLSGDYEAAIHYLQQAIDLNPSYYAKAQINLARAKRLQFEHPPVKIAKQWQGEKPQVTVYEIGM